MPTDLAIDYNTGDLILSPNNDISVRTGIEVTEQRIRVRLRVIQGEWVYDPTGGLLGSRILETVRLPDWRAREEAALIVREALEPMEDIRVQNVEVEVVDDDRRHLSVSITYVPVEEGEEVQTDEEQTITTTLTIAG